MVALPHRKVLAQGSRGDGTLAWCTVETEVGHVNIGSVYAPNSRVARIELWKWMSTHLHEGHWVLAGDWNMVEMFDDSVGRSAHLHGTEERSWKRLVENLDLMDQYFMVVARKGPVYTR